jgi:hypothetical protein
LSPLVTQISESARVKEGTPDLEWHTPAECVRLAASQNAPVVWIGGAEPMLHPEIGEVAAALVASGRHVFLHTSGAGVRTRIHEFVPVSRLFFAFEFAGSEASHDRFTGQPRSFRRMLEAIRTAKLSGFLVCAHVTVNSQTELAEISKLFEILGARDVDGFLASSAGNCFSLGEPAAMQSKLQEIRGLVRSRPWARFSELLESSYSEAIPAPARPHLRGDQPDACEETA